MGNLIFFNTDPFLYCKKRKETHKKRKKTRRTSGTRIIKLETGCRRKSTATVKNKKKEFSLF